MQKYILEYSNIKEQSRDMNQYDV